MRVNARLLIIGPAALGAAVGEALPRCEHRTADHVLAGLWTLGQEPFDGVVLALATAQRNLSAIGRLREVAPQVRIVVACSPSQEPAARLALEAGADEYVLEPLRPAELQKALQMVSPSLNPLTLDAHPSLQELVLLSEVLKNLGQGPQAALDRLADLLRDAYQARNASIQLDGWTAGVGEAAEPALEEPICRHGQVVGRVALGPSRNGPYGATAATRLADFARLIETVIAQACERTHWQELAWHDDLTGLHNRRFFDKSLDELAERSLQQRSRVTVLLFDIDDFKSYNDRFGHETGDALLREVALLLTRCSRETDVVARYGGDEFAVVFWDAEKPRIPGSQHPTDVAALAERFCRTIAAHDFKCLGRSGPGPITVSGGLACLPWDGQTRADLVRAADAALLAAKRTGKNRIAFADGMQNGGAPPRRPAVDGQEADDAALERPTDIRPAPAS